MITARNSLDCECEGMGVLVLRSRLSCLARSARRATNTHFGLATTVALNYMERRRCGLPRRGKAVQRYSCGRPLSDAPALLANATVSTRCLGLRPGGWSMEYGTLGAALPVSAVLRA